MDEYVIRVACDEDGTDETIALTPEQFEGVRLLAERVNRHNEEVYWVGPGIFVLSKNGEVL